MPVMQGSTYSFLFQERRGMKNIGFSHGTTITSAAVEACHFLLPIIFVHWRQQSTNGKFAGKKKKNFKFAVE